MRELILLAFMASFHEALALFIRPGFVQEDKGNEQDLYEHRLMGTRNHHRSRFRRLPPAAGFPSVQQLCNAWRQIRQSHRTVSLDVSTRRVLTEFLGLREIAWTANGKQALAAILRQARSRLGRDEVLIAAFTCPDVATAAFNSGCSLRLVDVDPDRLQMRDMSKHMSTKTLAVVYSNLFGFPDALHRELTQPNVLMIDDASQSALSMRDGVHVGADENVLGVLSFGRGKSFCGIGGGAVTLPGGTSALLEDIFRGMELAPRATTALENIQQLFLETAAWALQHPHLYSIAEALPFLHLGETQVHLTFCEGGISDAQLLVLNALVHAREARTSMAQTIASRWQELIRTLNIEQPHLLLAGAVPVRYPVLLRNRDTRERVLRRLTAAGLGAAASYPKTINEYPELREQVTFDEINGAKDIAERLLLLPVHPFVRMEDQEHTIELIQDELPSAHPSKRPSPTRMSRAFAYPDNTQASLESTKWNAQKILIAKS